MMAAPAWAAKKITVQQLKDLLVSSQQAKKGDEDVATQLKQVELSEELTAAVKSDLLFASPGPLTSEQICVLEARSAMLAPPPSDLPGLPSPDAAAQRAILDKAIDFAAKSNQQSPHMTASKMISRYGHLNAFGDPVRRGMSDQSIMSLTSKYTETVDINQGIEKVSASGVDPHLRRISPTSESSTRPALSLILRQADEGGNIHWLRWETILGARAAVFSFAVDKSKSLYGVDYCCFLTPGQVGGTDWKPFKKAVGLHGEFFIDPDTGKTLRIVIQAEFAPTDFVDREDTRIDFGAVIIGGNTYIVPVGSFTHTEVISSGDSFNKFSTSRTLLVASYINYRLAGTAHK